MTSPAPVTPYCLAMILCDAIHLDPGTQKKTLLGIFSSILARQLPSMPMRFSVFVSMSDGAGTVPFRLHITDADETESLADISAEITFSDRREVMALLLSVDGVVFPRAGEYRIQVFVNGEFLMERRLLVISPGAKP